tara:strand:- start:390 stop:1460 length:1071 start_codon:yes stop_codon:yes gene_type:complete
MANVTYTVPNKNGSYDGDMVVKQYTSVNIDAGDIVTVDQPCRGIFILSQGDVNINGEIRMKGLGAFADPTASGGSDNNPVQSSGLQFPFRTSGGSTTFTAANTLLNGCGTTARSVIANFKTLASDGTVLTVVRQGANGGATTGVNNTGNNGSAGSTGQSGGGGSGACNYVGSGGAGAYGSCFSGGSGGGPGDNGTGTAGANWGGAGGNGSTAHGATGSGGAGNPNGSDYATGGGGLELGHINGHGGTEGTGGLVIIVAGGNVTIGSNGKIDCRGGQSKHVFGKTEWSATGGGSGGGNIIIAHKGTYTNNGEVTCAGGPAGRLYTGTYGYGGTEMSGTYTRRGGDGGTGSVQTLQII